MTNSWGHYEGYVDDTHEIFRRMPNTQQALNEPHHIMM